MEKISRATTWPKSDSFYNMVPFPLTERSKNALFTEANFFGQIIFLSLKKFWELAEHVLC
jgi:hypothetical protein